MIMMVQSLLKTIFIILVIFEIYLTEEEHNMFAQEDDNNLEGELEQYHKVYMHAIDDVRKIKLRSRDVTINKGRLNPNQPSSS